MKKTETFVVLRDKKTGNFLTNYENNNRSFAYSATWTDDLRDAANNSVKSIERQIDKMQKLASLFDGELLKVTATYELETLDGKEPEDLIKNIEEAKRKHFKNFLEHLLSDDEED